MLWNTTKLIITSSRGIIQDGGHCEAGHLVCRVNTLGKRLRMLRLPQSPWITREQYSAQLWVTIHSSWCVLSHLWPGFMGGTSLFCLAGQFPDNTAETAGRNHHLDIFLPQSSAGSQCYKFPILLQELSCTNLLEVMATIMSLVR